MTTINDHNIYVIGMARTPIGSLNGSLSTMSAVQLGAVAIRAAISRSGISVNDVDEVIMGNVLTANEGQAPARQAAIHAGLPHRVICTTINKVCASGMKAVQFAAAQIKMGQADVVVAGGMESMSNCPFYMPKTARTGMRFGHQEVLDGNIIDGLWDPYNNIHMGECAEHVAAEFALTRAMQDEYALRSYQRAAKSTAEKIFAQEIVPVEIPGGKGKPAIIVSEDEEINKLNVEKMKTLSTPFKAQNGTVTAANASAVNDGAAALVLISGKKFKSLQLPQHSILAVFRSFADAAIAPINFPIAPASAVPIALSRAGLTTDDVDLFEFNEAFSCVALANSKILSLDLAKVNVLGGAVAIGHPIGCSGARIIITLITALKNSNGKIGCASVCNGGGGASALVLQRLI